MTFLNKISACALSLVLVSCGTTAQTGRQIELDLQPGDQVRAVILHGETDAVLEQSETITLR